MIASRIILVLALLSLTTSAPAQATRESLQTLSSQLQKAPNDLALREQVIKLAQTLKPAPAIPEEARKPFVMGAALLKKASGPADAVKAAELFTTAIEIAPWYADAYYNRAVACETAGQFHEAMDNLKTYLLFKLPVQERREVQDKIYALEVDAQLAATKKAEQEKVASAEAAARQAEQAKRQAGQAKRDVVATIKRIVNNRRYNCAILSSNQTNAFAGVTKNELLGYGKYWLFGNYNYYIYDWRFFDTRVEIWVTANNGFQHCVVRGEALGPNISDIQWSNENGQAWASFDQQSGELTIASSNAPRPLTDQGFDPNRRYCYDRYGPPN